MNVMRRAAAAALLALILILAVGCGGHAGTQSPPPPTPSASPSATATTPAPVPSPTAVEPSTAPGTRVLSSRVAYQWHWPNWNGTATVTHQYPVPPVPQLVAIGAGDHPRDPGERPFNRLSFTFTTGFPSYQFLFVMPQDLVADPSGRPVRLDGLDALKVTFRQAQAHTDSGASSIVTAPPTHLGMSRMLSYANAGDFEGVLSYGIGINRPVPQSNPQYAVRAYEVELLTPQGQHRYVVAIDVDAS